METSSHITSTYAALRYGGASQDRARAELAITPGEAHMQERIFNVARPGKMLDRMRPRFARHEAHVAAILAAGGYPVLRR
ncbi:MAG: hypothetical protein KKE02_09975 [Alphaproteobacteria bacterium]|nr:hypothetical protein [Alphaproteobacteria bacterium]MBU1516861.1 hypothetical protein [Alphaproteobacteria bacterium]MBU2092555.1 hypothetical protein [Alphaproteobacteria bacterium]MBU2151333.1 hypothetical protein [Alphaproteobacteria bacterium]MBU2309636.1 hypothetical protein [Alphaproteobacteria bacterium]